MNRKKERKYVFLSFHPIQGLAWFVDKCFAFIRILDINYEAKFWSWTVVWVCVYVCESECVHVFVYIMTWLLKARIVERIDAAVARQWCSKKHVSAAVNQHATIEELLVVVFLMQSVPRLYSKEQWEKSISWRMESWLAVLSCILSIPYL
jgi:hypothetical protein